MNTSIKPTFIPFKCVNCSGYGSTSYGRDICKVCKGKGFIIINQTTGKPVKDDDDGNENNLH